MDTAENNAQLSHTFDKARLSHAYIVPGEEQARPLTLAALCSGGGRAPCMTCAHCGKVLRGVHPDVSVIDTPKGGREIVVDQIRALKADVPVVPNEAARKVCMILNADTMNTAAQNALLRVLEEPPSHTVFILVTQTPARLLPTVRSRCVSVNEPQEPETLGGGDMASADDFLAAVEGGQVALLEFSFGLDKLEKNELSAFITAARRRVSERLRESIAGGGAISPETLSSAENALCRAAEYMELNVGAGHISGLILASLLTT